MNCIHSNRGRFSVYALFIASIIILSLLIGCKKKSTTPVVDGILFGHVTDSLSAAPVESAGIYAYGLTSNPRYTDSLGYYSFSLAPNTGIDIYCQKNGYNTRLSQCSIAASESTRLDFQLRPVQQR